jgi:hypothetical protein
MGESREELTAILESLYRRGEVWGEPARADDGTVRVTDSGNVTWIGLAVVPEDLEDPGFPERLRELASRREPDGRLCPLEVLPADGCRAAVEAVLRELRLEERVSVYSLAA